MPEKRESRFKLFRPFVFGVVLVVALAAVFLFDYRAVLAKALDFIEGLGFWGPFLFILVYALATVLFVPGSIMTLGAGLAFGVVWGSVWVTVAANIGAFLAFLTGRYFARDWVSEKIESNRMFKAVDGAVGSESWKIVALVRLSPVMPFNLVNYAFGLTKVRALPYAVMSFFGMIPGTILYVYLGSLARVESEGRSTGEWVLYGIGLVATVLVTIIVTKAARRELAKTLPLEPEAEAS